MAVSSTMLSSQTLREHQAVPHRLLAVSSHFSASSRVVLSAGQEATIRAQNGIFCVRGGSGTGKTTALLRHAEARSNENTRGVLFVRDASERQRVEPQLARRARGFATQTLLGFSVQVTRAPFRQNLVQEISPDLIVERWETPLPVAAIAIRALEIFFRSVDIHPDATHISSHDQIFAMKASELGAGIDVARRVWAAMLQCDFPLTREACFKLYALSQPVMPFDAILVDDAEDLTPVMLDLLRRQRHATVIYAGDPCLASLSNRSIFDAAAAHDAPIGVFDLGQSWRMTQPVADLAGRALGLVGVSSDISGKADESGPMLDTRLAVIGRSTGVLIEKAAECAGFGVHWLGGCEGLGRLLSVYHQFAGRREHVQDGVVQNFASYDVLKDFAAFAGDEDLLSLARVVERYGHDTPALAMEILDNAVQSRAGQSAEVYATAQQAKGHSWDRVQIAGDFDCGAGDVDREDARQLYLAITRANREIEIPPALTERLAAPGV